MSYLHFKYKIDHNFAVQEVNNMSHFQRVTYKKYVTCIHTFLIHVCHSCTEEESHDSCVHLRCEMTDKIKCYLSNRKSPCSFLASYLEGDKISLKN